MSMEMRCVVFVCLTPMCITLLVQVFSVFLGDLFSRCVHECVCMYGGIHAMPG